MSGLELRGPPTIDLAATPELLTAIICVTTCDSFVVCQLNAIHFPYGDRVGQKAERWASCTKAAFVAVDDPESVVGRDGDTARVRRPDGRIFFRLV